MSHTIHIDQKPSDDERYWKKYIEHKSKNDHVSADKYLKRIENQRKDILTNK